MGIDEIMRSSFAALTLAIEFSSARRLLGSLGVIVEDWVGLEGGIEEGPELNPNFLKKSEKESSSRSAVLEEGAPSEDGIVVMLDLDEAGAGGRAGTMVC